MKRISDKVAKLIDEQIKHEGDSSRLYLAMSQWLEYSGYECSAKLFKKYADEELIHMNKFYQYLQDRNFLPSTPILDAQPIEFGGIKEIIKLSYEHEIKVSMWLDNIAMTALSEKCLTTFNFMSWFILEQIEEEAKFKKMLDRLEMMDKDKAPMILFDQELGKMA